MERAMVERAMWQGKAARRQGGAARHDVHVLTKEDAHVHVPIHVPSPACMSRRMPMYRRLHARQGACPCAPAWMHVKVHVKAHVHVPSPQGKPCQTCRDAPAGNTPRVNAARGIPISKPATPLDGVVMLHVGTLHGFV
mmetsp:Transcript_5863/g.9396  ORF Transcript_5863/g.9396 Transcript_5863/m.9396 type:complete len:138 (+) Transcript_5863:76-489(+)